jgi:hypothetical protein
MHPTDTNNALSIHHAERAGLPRKSRRELRASQCKGEQRLRLDSAGTEGKAKLPQRRRYTCETVRTICVRFTEGLRQALPAKRSWRCSRRRRQAPTMLGPNAPRCWRWARAHKIDAILVTELSRWGRSTQDLVQTLDDLAGKLAPGPDGSQLRSQHRPANGSSIRRMAGSIASPRAIWMRCFIPPDSCRGSLSLCSHNPTSRSSRSRVGAEAARVTPLMRARRRRSPLPLAMEIGSYCPNVAGS